MLLAGLAMIIDAVTGEPKWLYSRIKHPVSWMAGSLMYLETHLNRKRHRALRRKALGTLTVVVLTVLWGGVGFGIEQGLKVFLSDAEELQLATSAIVASVLIASRSLVEHVIAVKKALASGLDAGRTAVSLIVGRDTGELDEIGVARAATESLAENFSDGVVAPIFWLSVAGLPGLFVYKMINTADSVIGHKTSRHMAFGWASAKLDDVLNFVPARLTALILIISGVILRIPKSLDCWQITLKEAPTHVSPNAGWPEATMAGLLKVRLGGPRAYAAGQIKEYAWLGKEFSSYAWPDTGLAIRLVIMSCITITIGLLAGGLL